MFKITTNKPKIFLHIGMNKTGSTAIQAWLNTNKDHLLRTDGIYYPLEGLQGGAHYGLSDELGFKLGGFSINDKRLNDLQKKFLASIKENKCDKVIFSSENFVLDKDLHSIKQFFKGFDCKVVVYLRRHDCWWESLYNQSLKMVRAPKYPKGIEAFITHQKRVSNIGNFKALLERWAQAFGKENLIVRPYETRSLKNGIVADFLQVIDYVNHDSIKSSKKINASLSKHANAVLEVAQRSGLDDIEVNKVLLFLRENDIKENNFSLLPSKRRRAMVNYNYPQYQYIAEHYLKGSDNVLFSEKWPELDEEWEVFTPLEPEEILVLILKAINK